MKLLALDTSTDACSCAVYDDGTIYQRYELAPRKHAELILPMADSLLAEAGLQPRDMDAVVFGCGPGSFTGLRISCGVAQGIAFAADIPVIPVSSLAALAQAAYQQYEKNHVCVAVDARMEEVYWGEYHYDEQTQLMTLVDEERVCTPEQIPALNRDASFGVGNGWGVYGTRLQTHFDEMITEYIVDYYPRAEMMLPFGVHQFRLGNTVEAAQASPVYLRNKVT